MRPEEFRGWVKKQLGEDGCPSVQVELSDGQMDQALANAKEWFSVFVEICKEATVALVAGKSEYDLSAVTPGVGSVVAVWFPGPSSQLDFSVLYPGFLDVEGIPYGETIGGSASWGGGYPQATAVQTMQTLASTERAFGADLNWEFYADDTTTPATRMLRIMPPPGSGRTGTCIYRYSIHPDDLQVEWFSRKYRYFLKQWALADCKYILGRKRAKFSSVSTAGGDKQLDGEALIQESREEKEALEAKILDMDGPPMPEVY